MRTLTGLACTLALAGPGPAPAAPQGGGPGAAALTTVLAPAEGPHLLGVRASGYWTPRPAALRRLEARLPPAVAGYCRQYLGIVRGGRRLILVNGFSAAVAPEFPDWRRHAVSVLDGGRGFFTATYDPRTDQFAGPEFNGLG